MWHMYMLTCFLSTLMVRLVCSFDLFRIISSHSPNIVTFGLNFARESGIPRKRRIPVSIPISNGRKARNPLSFFDKITPFSTYKLVKIRGLRVHYSFLDSPPPCTTACVIVGPYSWWLWVCILQVWSAYKMVMLIYCL